MRNYGYGIRIDLSVNNTIEYNLIADCGDYGIYLYENYYLYYTANNTIRYNTLHGNSHRYTQSQAYDGGIDNLFINNYWSDWSGTGNYSIDGLANNFDLFPLGVPPVPIVPEINTSLISSLISIFGVGILITLVSKKKH